MNKSKQITKEEVLEFHDKYQPTGQLSITLNKPLNTGRELSLAYSPGVAHPCLEIQREPDLSFQYTSRSHYVAMISNGTAVLGLGNIGALASKPVMEGKCALFKKFANVDATDIEVETQNVEEFINVVKNIGRTWGAINLEDIKAPECFEIETKLQELLDIPVFHDDQHGTAIVSLAALINASEIINKDIKNLKIVINGAGAAAIAVANLIKKYEVPNDNVIMCDTNGVIYKGRKEGMNKYKEIHAINTECRTLTDAVKNADVFIGLSKKGALTKEMLQSMAKNPIIFAMANPDPEITPDEAFAIRDDIIIGTGRSDYPNQINNSLCFPYLFRGLLDVNAKKVTDDIKIIVSLVLAKLAKDSFIPDEVKNAYPDRKFEFGKNYIIPTMFDPRMLSAIAPEVAKITMELGFARKTIDVEEYRKSLI